MYAGTSSSMFKKPSYLRSTFEFSKISKKNFFFSGVLKRHLVWFIKKALQKYSFFEIFKNFFKCKKREAHYTDYKSMLEHVYIYV